MDGSDERAVARARIEEEAARLVVSLDATDDPAAHAAAAAWADRSPVHAVAFARAEAAWETSARLRAAPPPLEPEAIAGPAGRFEALFNRRSVIGGLLAASLVAGIGTVALQKITAVDRYRTAVGERRSVALADGSHIRLNTASVVEVSFTRHQRLIHLLQGEAWFDVARDPVRPFLVHAGPATLRAVGTAFNVRIRQELVELTVTRGAVGVEDAQLPPRSIVAGGGAAIRDGAVVPTGLDAPAVRQRIAWQNGIIELDGDTLPQAIEEFNRYRHHPMVIGDPRLASIRVGGRFATGDSAQFIDALQQSFAILAVAGPDRSILLVRAD